MKLNDILNEGIVRDYHMSAWKDKLGIPEEVIELYGITGDEQRARPEIAMTGAQAVIGGGVLSFCLEHVGDISNRASPMHGFDWGREEAAGKAERCLRTLKHPYGFAREHNENLVSYAKFKEIPLDEHKAEVDRVLKTYADAHRKLKVYNKPQELARDAAIALGDQRFNDAIPLLEEFIRIADDEDAYIAAMKAYYKTPA